MHLTMTYIPRVSDQYGQGVLLSKNVYTTTVHVFNIHLVIETWGVLRGTLVFNLPHVVMELKRSEVRWRMTGTSLENKSGPLYQQSLPLSVNVSSYNITHTHGHTISDLKPKYDLLSPCL